MTTFVLIHGAFRGAWSWQRVRRLLTAAGHEVFTPSLTGMGDRRHLPVASLETWALDIATLLDDEDLDQAVLAGHSQGGIAVVAAAARCAPRLARLVFVDAPDPLPGERAVDLTGPAPDLPRSLVLPPSPVSLDDPALAAWVNARLGPTPLAPSLDPLPARPPDVPRSYVFCSRTPPGYPSWVTRSRLDAAAHPYTVLDSDHDAPLTHPALVAAALTQDAGA
ncbi:alpha/beta hydrolase [Dactylosporangium sucinum]|uniref:Esterase n=1 Tax=Dactylosporangium sucinum TaxID=1424081 RepID=A0A917X0E7_9ACTN|nr:alpha/beta fold hydrolase [Dactylosporangium sucinum]GGM53905.1 esterase [Dactylosporangium sucinum]